MIRRIFTVGGFTLALARHRLHPRHRDGGDPRRRADRRRFLRRLPAAQSFPRDLRRGRVQRRVRAGLCARAGARRRRRGAALRRPDRRGDGDRADRAARSGARLHAAGDAVAGARICRRSGALRSRGRAHAHHLSLSGADLARDADRGHAQRQPALRFGGGGADPAQPLHDRHAHVSPRCFRPRVTRRPGAC